jgi:protein O-GlcNAc transferase
LLGPAHVAALHSLANVLADTGEFAEAAELFRRVLELQPEHAEAHYNLGNLKRRRRELNPASNCYREAIWRLRSGVISRPSRCSRSLPKRTVAWREVFGDRGDFAGAEKSRQAIALKPELATARNYLGYAFAEQGVERLGAIVTRLLS